MSNSPTNGPADRAGLTQRQRELHAAVLRLASSIDEQMLVISVVATRLGCSTATIEAVRTVLLAGHTRECGDRR